MRLPCLIDRSGLAPSLGRMSVPTIPFDISQTLVFDRENQQQIHRYDHAVFVPIGAEIELVDPNISAYVVGVRVLAGTKDIPAVLCLDVRRAPSGGEPPEGETGEGWGFGVGVENDRRLRGEADD